MSTINTSPIEQKINENNRDNANDDNNWFGFIKGVLYYFILTLVWGVIGANFIFLTSSDKLFLEKILPTTVSKFTSYFPHLASQKGGHAKRGGGNGGEYYNDEDCDKGMNFSMGNLESLGIGNVNGWPYYFRTSEHNNYIFFRDFLNWMIDTIYGSFAFNRKLLQNWLTLFSKKNGNFLSNDIFQMIFVAPFTLMVAPLAGMVGFFVSFYSAFNTNANMGILWAILGLLFGYTWMLSSSISVVQFVQYLLLFLMLPLITNLNKVKNILKCNIKLLSFVFGLFVCVAALESLNMTTSIVMFILFILMTIKSFW